MSERFYTSQPLDSGPPVLGEDEARHLVSVMRAQVGDEVILFDGTGDEWLARIDSIEKQRVELELVERRQIDRELPFQLTLAVALPKGERQKWLVEKATELGVTRLVPLVTQRGVAQPVAAAIVRLRRTVIEACKQCGRNRLMEIAEPVSARDYWTADVRRAVTLKMEGDQEADASRSPSRLRLLADPSGQPLAELPRQRSQPLTIAVGPEGGFSPEEVATATSAGWMRVSLGPRVLRVETAAIALASWAGTN